MSAANPVRGEASVRVAGEAIVLRPSFQALVAAEGELGSLFALVERAGEGRIALSEVAALFWHCRHGAPAALTREQLGEAIVTGGLTRSMPVLRTLLGQVLDGR
ncbi:MAG TPA: gene transfer agent family protein [Sphingomonas sp.]